MRELIGTACIATTLMYVGSAPASAQEAIGPTIAENIAAGRSATDFSSRLRIRTAYLDLPEERWLISTQLSGTFAPHPSVELRLQVPLVYFDPGVVGGEFGASDLTTRVLWRAFDHPRASAFVGLEFVFPTASNPLLGTEKYSIAPTAAAFFPLFDGLYFIPVYQQLISYAGDKERPDLNTLRIRTILLANWPGRWWTLLDPGFLWDLEDDRPTKDTMTSRPRSRTAGDGPDCAVG